MHKEELNYHFKGASLSLSTSIPAAATSNLHIKGTVHHIDDWVVNFIPFFFCTFEICIGLLKSNPSV